MGLLISIRVMVLISTVDSRYYKSRFCIFYGQIGMRSQNRIIAVYVDLFSYETNNPRWKEVMSKSNFSVYKNQKESVKKWSTSFLALAQSKQRNTDLIIPIWRETEMLSKSNKQMEMSCSLNLSAIMPPHQKSRRNKDRQPARCSKQAKNQRKWEGKA